jgi:predicted lipoprotein with Yx(FWY)xxD motif
MLTVYFNFILFVCGRVCPHMPRRSFLRRKSMVFVKRFLFTAIGLLFAVLVSACGTPTSSTSGNSSYSAPAATTAPSTPTALIKTTTATVSGKSVTLLTDAQGKTLYYFTPDTATTSACTDTCIQNWPPLLMTGSGSPTSATTLTGTLTTVKTGAGEQVEYNSHMLYTFAGDSTPGQVNGEGKAGKWFVATSDLPVGNSAAATTSTTSSAPAVVKTTTVTVSGKSETVLTTADGMTLYYFVPDTAAKTACTGGCVASWPALLFTGSGSPSAATKLPGELEVYPNANGKQVIYNDHPLYTFTGDTAAGQTNGQGVGGKWFVVTPDIAKNK